MIYYKDIVLDTIAASNVFKTLPWIEINPKISSFHWMVLFYLYMHER